MITASECDIGKLLFDLVIDFLTGGTGKAGRMAKSILKNFIDKVRNEGVNGFYKVMEDAWNASKKKPIFKTVLAGCFVNGTIIRTASGYYPIEQLQPARDSFSIFPKSPGTPLPPPAYLPQIRKP